MNLAEFGYKNFNIFQAALLQSCEQAAESPTKLQEQIVTILRDAPNLAEAVSLCYLATLVFCIILTLFNVSFYSILYSTSTASEWENSTKRWIVCIIISTANNGRIAASLPRATRAAWARRRIVVKDFVMLL